MAQVVLRSAVRGVVSTVTVQATPIPSLFANSPPRRGMWWPAFSRFLSAGGGGGGVDAAENRSPMPPGFKADNKLNDMKEPAFVRGLEKKAMEELADMHVDAVDDDEEELVVVDGKGTFSWIDEKTGERGGPKGSLRGAEPTRFGDWELNGRCSDF